MATQVHGSEGQAFIDTMVWSSARPDSVKLMIERTFGERARHLIAVWDRTYFGLSLKEYRKYFAENNKRLTVINVRSDYR